MRRTCMKLLILIGFALFATALYAQQGSDVQHPTVFLPEASYEFKPVLEGKKVVHDFLLQNKGDGPLKIVKIRTG